MLVEDAYVQNWLAFEDPDNPGVMMYSTCNVGYGKPEDVTVNNYFAEEGQARPEWGNSSWDSVDGATYWDTTDTMWGFNKDELDPEKSYASEEMSQACTMYALQWASIDGNDMDPELNPSYEQAIKDGKSYSGTFGYRIWSSKDNTEVVDSAAYESTFTFTPVDVLDRLPPSTWDEDWMVQMREDADILTRAMSELTTMAEDPEYWTRDSTLADFSYEEFLNQYSLSDEPVNMSSVNFVDGFDFSSFSLTDWLEQYNLTERFNMWLEFLGNNADPYNTDDFDL